MARKENDQEWKSGKRRAWEYVLLLAVVVWIPCAAILGVFYPNYQECYVGGWDFLYKGVILLGVGCIIPYIAVILYVGSPRIVAGSKSWTRSHSEKWPLRTIAPAPVDVTMMKGVLKPQEMVEAERVAARRGEGMMLKREAHSLGGFNSLGFGLRSLAPFEAGLVITEGEGHYIEFGTNIVFTHPLRRVDYSNFDTETLNSLEHGAEDGGPLRGWNRDKPLWTTGPTVFQELRSYLTEYLEPQSIVLRHIGFDGLAARFVAEVEAEGKARGWVMDNPETQKLITDRLRSWLQTQEPLRIAMEQDYATSEFNAARRYELEAEVHRLRRLKGLADQEATVAREGLRARTERQASLAGAKRPEPPAWANVQESTGDRSR